MKAWQKIVAAMFAATLVVGASGCASDSNRRGVNETGAVASDSWITTKVKSDLAVEKDVSATAIHVDTYEGVVTLSGTVDTQAEASRAEEIARDIEGVKSVKNNLQVKS